MNQKTLGSKQNYIDKVMNTKPDNLIGYWPLNETSGNIAYDLSGNNNHGIIYGNLSRQDGIGDGNTSLYFPGVVGNHIDIYSTNFSNLFSGNEGTAIIWGLNRNVTSTSNYLLSIRYASAKSIILLKFSSPPIAQCWIQANFYNSSEQFKNDWNCLALSWKNSGFFEFLHKGKIQQHIAYTGYSDKITAAKIGCLASTGSTPWFGNIAHVSVWNTQLTHDEMYNLGLIS